MALKADQGTRSSERNSIGKDGDFLVNLSQYCNLKCMNFFIASQDATIVQCFLFSRNGNSIDVNVP